MELVQELYNALGAKGKDWPEHALIAIRDSDGEIKFSSVSKEHIVETKLGIYMRRTYCLFNTRMVEAHVIEDGTKDCPTIVTKSEYEKFFYAKA